MDDDDFAIAVLEPQRHNRWAVIVPVLGFASEVFEAAGNTFKAYTVYAAQHGMQKHYDQKFREITR